MCREKMNEALKTGFVPILRQLGFKGSLPHFRRRRDEGVDLLTIQFDRHGGGFAVEISRCGVEGVTTHWGEHIPAAKVTAHDLHPDQRHRLGSPAPNVDGRWFRFDDGTLPMAVVGSLCTYIEEAERWWAAG
jgi:hypothetical protein